MRIVSFILSVHIVFLSLSPMLGFHLHEKHDGLTYHTHDTADSHHHAGHVHGHDYALEEGVALKPENVYTEKSGNTATFQWQSGHEPVVPVTILLQTLLNDRVSTGKLTLTVLEPLLEHSNTLRGPLTIGPSCFGEYFIRTEKTVTGRLSADSCSSRAPPFNSFA